MNSTGIVRKIDNLGRIVLPKELRKTFDISKEDPMEIFTEENYIMLKKYQPACVFCDEANEVVSYKGKNICQNCAREVGELNL